MKRAVFFLPLLLAAPVCAQFVPLSRENVQMVRHGTDRPVFVEFPDAPPGTSTNWFNQPVRTDSTVTFHKVNAQSVEADSILLNPDPPQDLQNLTDWASDYTAPTKSDIVNVLRYTDIRDEFPEFRRLTLKDDNGNGGDDVGFAVLTDIPSGTSAYIQLHFDNPVASAQGELYADIHFADTGGWNRTVTLGDWFDQGVKTTSSPTFVRVALTDTADSSPLLWSGQTEVPTKGEVYNALEYYKTQATATVTTAAYGEKSAAPPKSDDMRLVGVPTAENTKTAILNGDRYLERPLSSSYLPWTEPFIRYTPNARGFKVYLPRASNYTDYLSTRPPVFFRVTNLHFDPSMYFDLMNAEDTIPPPPGELREGVDYVRVWGGTTAYAELHDGVWSIYSSGDEYSESATIVKPSDGEVFFLFSTRGTRDAVLSADLLVEGSPTGTPAVEFLVQQAFATPPGTATGAELSVASPSYSILTDTGAGIFDPVGGLLAAGEGRVYVFCRTKSTDGVDRMFVNFRLLHR